MWILFRGKAERSTAGWVLRPHEDPQIEIEMRHADVQVEDDAVTVKVGAFALRIDIPEHSKVNTKPLRLSKPGCAGKSRCVSGTEFCCDDMMIGNCHGYWNDCKKEESMPFVDDRDTTTARSGRPIQIS